MRWPNIPKNLRVSRRGRATESRFAIYLMIFNNITRRSPKVTGLPPATEPFQEVAWVLTNELPLSCLHHHVHPGDRRVLCRHPRISRLLEDTYYAIPAGMLYNESLCFKQWQIQNSVIRRGQEFFFLLNFPRT